MRQTEGWRVRHGKRVMPDAAQAMKNLACGAERKPPKKIGDEWQWLELTKSLQAEKIAENYDDMSARWRKSKTPASAQKPMCWRRPRN